MAHVTWPRLTLVAALRIWNISVTTTVPFLLWSPRYPPNPGFADSSPAQGPSLGNVVHVHSLSLHPVNLAFSSLSTKPLGISKVSPCQQLPLSAAGWHFPVWADSRWLEHPC